MTADPLGTSFDARFDDLAAVAYRVAFRLLGSRDDAEDIAQEALARAHSRWRRVNDHAEPWVARVASNLAIDVLRKRPRGIPAQPHGRTGWAHGGAFGDRSPGAPAVDP